MLGIVHSTYNTIQEMKRKRKNIIYNNDNKIEKKCPRWSYKKKTSIYCVSNVIAGLHLLMKLGLWILSELVISYTFHICPTVFVSIIYRWEEGCNTFHCHCKQNLEYIFWTPSYYPLRYNSQQGESCGMSICIISPAALNTSCHYIFSFGHDQNVYT